MANWYDGTVLADHAHRQQHGFDTWSDEEWQDSYPGRSPNKVHEYDHANPSVTSDLEHTHGDGATPSLEDGLLRLGPDAPSPEAQQEVERVMRGGNPDAYLDRIDHDRGHGG